MRKVNEQVMLDAVTEHKERRLAFESMIHMYMYGCIRITAIRTGQRYGYGYLYLLSSFVLAPLYNSTSVGVFSEKAKILSATHFALSPPGPNCRELHRHFFQLSRKHLHRLDPYTFQDSLVRYNFDFKVKRGTLVNMAESLEVRRKPREESC